MLKFVILGFVATTLVHSAAVHDLSISGDLLQGNFRIGDGIRSDGLFAAESSIDVILEKYLALAKDETTFSNIFSDFKKQFDKTYTSSEHEAQSKELFQKRLLMVLENNLKALHGQSTYVQTLYEDSDKSLEEMLVRPAGQWPSVEKFYQANPVAQGKPEDQDKEYVDSWVFDLRTEHQVTSIANQGGCGACVYFAASATIESFWARKGHGLVHLSPQQLNDCARDEPHGNHGCQKGGGTFVPTFNYIKSHGLTSEQNYPYQGKDMDCKKDQESKVVARISNWTPITPHGDEMALESAVHEHGGAAVAIHVSDGIMHYKSGIFDGDCKGGRNHAVLLMGYGWDDATKRDYWILKNQWGENWGDHGFFKLQRKHGNMCDVAGDAVYVT